MIVISGALIMPVSVTSLYSQHMGIYWNTYGEVDILICIIDREMERWNIAKDANLALISFHLRSCYQYLKGPLNT